MWTLLISSQTHMQYLKIKEAWSESISHASHSLLSRILFNRIFFSIFGCFFPTVLLCFVPIEASCVSLSLSPSLFVYMQSFSVCLPAKFVSLVHLPACFSTFTFGRIVLFAAIYSNLFSLTCFLSFFPNVTASLSF